MEAHVKILGRDACACELAMLIRVNVHKDTSLEGTTYKTEGVQTIIPAR